MQIPVQVTFRHMDPSPALEERVRLECAALERYSPQIVRCRAVVQAPHHHQAQGGLYEVRLQITAPEAEIVVDRTHGQSASHEDVYVAIRDSFRAARRQLEDYERRRRQQVKTHEPPPEGRIIELHSAEGFGRIETSDGRLVYFHRNSLVGSAFDALQTGMRVRFAEEPGEQGPQASSLHVL